MASELKIASAFFFDRRSPISSSVESGRPKTIAADAGEEPAGRGQRDVGRRLGDQLARARCSGSTGACGRSTRTRRSAGLRPLRGRLPPINGTPICWAGRVAGQWPRRYGTSAMTVCSRPTSAALSRLAVWLYSNRSHQWRATYSGRTTMVIGASLSGRPGLVEDVEVGDDRRDDRPERRLDDDQRDVRQLALPARRAAPRPRRGRRSRRRPGRRGSAPGRS